MLWPNATQWLQVLDVAVFGPMKRSWPVVLDDWKKESRRGGSFDKRHFPMLLSRLVNMMGDKLSVIMNIVRIIDLERFGF